MEQKNRIELPAAVRPTRKSTCVMLGEGFDEIEALAPIDVMRRAGMEVYSVSMTENRMVQGATGNRMIADLTIDELDPDKVDWLVFPGAAPGEAAVAPDDRIRSLIQKHWESGGKIAAICAAPALVLGPLGILKGTEATGYPFLKEEFARSGGRYRNDPVVSGDRLITAQGPGTTLEFALAIVRKSKGPETESVLRDGMVIPRCNCGEECNCGETCDCGEACACGDECGCGSTAECSCGETCDCGEACACGESAE